MKLFKVIGFIVGYLFPFGIVYLNHVVLIDGGYDIDLFGILVIALIILLILKKMDKAIDLWRIHKEHKKIIILYDNIKKIAIAGFLTWILFTIEDDIKRLQWTSVLILVCFIGGMILSLIGEKKHRLTK